MRNLTLLCLGLALAACADNPYDVIAPGATASDTTVRGVSSAVAGDQVPTKLERAAAPPAPPPSPKE